MKCDQEKKHICLFIALVLIVSGILSSCALFEPQSESPEDLILKASQQRIFLASYDKVWKAAHSVLKYTIASENQDFGTIETDYIKAVDGWIPPYKTKPDYPSSRYKLFFTFAKGNTNGKESTRLTIEKKIETFKDVISDTQTVASDGSEEKSLFYRIERELIILNAIEKTPTN